MADELRSFEFGDVCLEVWSGVGGLLLFGNKFLASYLLPIIYYLLRD